MQLKLRISRGEKKSGTETFYEIKNKNRVIKFVNESWCVLNRMWARNKIFNLYPKNKNASLVYLISLWPCFDVILGSRDREMDP